MQHFTGVSLKTRLYLLVLAAFIPVAILIFYIAEEQKSIETQAILNKTLMIARTAADAENQQLEATRNLLTAIVNAFPHMDAYPDKLSAYLAALLEQSKYYAAFGLVRPDGHLLAVSDPLQNGSMDYSETSWFAACLKNKQLIMGRYHGEHIHGEPVLYFALPAFGNHGQIAAIAFAALKLNWINDTISKPLAEVPGGSRLALLDGPYRMLIYNVDAGQWSLPERFDPSLQERIIRLQSGTLRATNEKGNSCIYAFAPLTSPFRDRPVTMILEIPLVTALAASRQLFVRNLALLIVSALLAVLFIWWASDVYILRRVRAMVAASRKLAAGDLGVRIGKIGAPDELSHLASVFDEMAASLQQRIESEAQVLDSLRQSREQIRKLAAYQQDVREKERIRIARELHDQFGQALTLLKMDLSWFKKHVAQKIPGVDQKIESMSEITKEALKTLHAVTAELRPVILDDFGLAAAIEWQVEEFQNRSGIACRMEPGGFEPVLPKDLATALFRIFQEILINIVRHARADEVIVRLNSSNGDLVLEVKDNGRGITEDEINDPKSYGILGMRERLYPWNGDVSFDSPGGHGTCVIVRIPIPRIGDS